MLYFNAKNVGPGKFHVLIWVYTIYQWTILRTIDSNRLSVRCSDSAHLYAFECILKVGDLDGQLCLLSGMLQNMVMLAPMSGCRLV